MFRQRYIKSLDINRKVIGLEVMVTVLNGIQMNSRVARKCEQLIVATIL